MSRSLDGKRVLITGGAGLIGSTLVGTAIDAGADEVVVFDDFSRGTVENLAHVADEHALTVVEGDICDRDQLRGVLGGIDVLFHMAAIRITRCADDPEAAMSVLVDGSFNVVEEARRAGVGKVVASSSASIYGAADVLPTDEWHHPYGNRTLYGAAKLFLEQLLRSYSDQYGLRYIALRYFNVYGPRMDTEGKYTEVFVRWMQRIDSGLAPVIFGDGSQSMDLVFTEDIARANLLAAVSDQDDEVFNVASGREVTMWELAIGLIEAMGAVMEPEFGPQRAVAAVPRRLADVSKARDLLGFQTEVDLDDGLRRLVSWWRSRTGPREASYGVPSSAGR